MHLSSPRRLHFFRTFIYIIPGAYGELENRMAGSREWVNEGFLWMDG
jgi:hypothetical protein